MLTLSRSAALQSYLTLAMVHIRMMRFTSAEAACAAPFLLPEMIDRVAGMLNYFLAHLAGPERRKLRLQQPDKHGWDPKALLSQLCGIKKFYLLYRRISPFLAHRAWAHCAVRSWPSRA